MTITEMIAAFEEPQEAHHLAMKLERWWPTIKVILQQHERIVAELDAAKATIEDEEAAHQDTLRLWQEAKAQHERAMRVVSDLAEWHQRCSAPNGDDFLNGDAGDGRCGHDEIEALGRRAAAFDSPSPGETG